MPTQPEPAHPSAYTPAEIDAMRQTYRDLIHTARSQEDAATLLHVCMELGKLGYVLNDDESDWTKGHADEHAT